MAAPSLTYTLTNGSTADATQVMQNFTDLLNGITDGTKDLSISALTAAGTATLNGAVNLGNAAADDITITGSLASSIPIKTTNSYNIGSSTLGLQSIYIGANGQTVRILGSGSMSATWSMTLPVSAGTANYALLTNGSGVTSWGQIVDASVSSSAAISGSKIAAATVSATGTVSREFRGAFTGTWTGMTATVTNTVRYNVVADTVLLYIPGQTGTSNANTFTITGLPSDILPARNQKVFGIAIDTNNVRLASYLVQTDGTMALEMAQVSGSNVVFSNFTSSGTKGTQATTISYTLY